MPRHPLSAALSCALLFASATLPAFAAEPVVSVAKVKWVMPWKAGVALDYATESLTDETKDGARQRSRSTDVTHMRIKDANDQGFIQSWASDGVRYEVLEGNNDEAERRAFNAQVADLVMEVELNPDGNLIGMHNLDAILPRLRKATEQMARQQAEKEFAKIADPKAREAARAKAEEDLPRVVDRFLSPALVQGLLTRVVSNYNGFFGVEVEPDQSYELALELPNPIGGAPLPAKLTFSMSISEEDAEDLYVAYDVTVDAEKAAAMALKIGEKIADSKATDQDKAALKSLDIQTEGLFVVHRPTGIIEMFEDTQTTVVGTTKKVERNRFRQLNGPHEHTWRDEETPEGEEAEQASSTAS